MVERTKTPADRFREEGGREVRIDICGLSYGWFQQYGIFRADNGELLYSPFRDSVAAWRLAKYLGLVVN